MSKLIIIPYNINPKLVGKIHMAAVFIVSTLHKQKKGSLKIIANPLTSL